MLDTNIIIAFLNQEADVATQIRNSARFAISCITVGGLLYGAHNSARVQLNLDRLDALFQDIEVLPCDAETSHFYARCKAQLKRIGRPINENDLWIAATAMQHTLTLVSRDDDFTAVEGLLLVKW
ncbi:type II toxin-antitoxin system VapC family toxin [Hymenobacter sp.]|uniref:type II toxin-antitoxin system VapC family toxin n=1 Tax=Hymenobacter sp. TaxID=1898978 RepID=UPI002ED9DDDF